ncbi:hypothetical protein R5M92_02150 [Halomonas sp. Bachu 37]|uniref:hypothetical protein n=1 Tax=Halomonas kashgarensis TaxID=3084920 RepID=UPI0032176703
MKINVEFDLTPDEFRQSLGLPDVEAFQQSLLGHIQNQMESGVEGYDPMSLMRPFLQQPMMQQGLSQGLANFGTYQQMMLDMLRQAGASAKQGNTASSGGDESGVARGDSSASRGEGDADKRKPAATSRSRRKRSES